MNDYNLPLQQLDPEHVLARALRDHQTLVALGGIQTLGVISGLDVTAALYIARTSALLAAMQHSGRMDEVEAAANGTGSDTLHLTDEEHALAELIWPVAFGSLTIGWRAALIPQQRDFTDGVDALADLLKKLGD